MSEENNEKKDLEVVQGIGNLDISPVYEDLPGARPKMQDEKPKNIVIPQEKKPIEKKESDSEDTKIDDILDENKEEIETTAEDEILDSEEIEDDVIIEDNIVLNEEETEEDSLDDLDMFEDILDESEDETDNENS